MRIAIPAVLALAVGCGGESDRCATPSGIYTATSQLQSTTCGPTETASTDLINLNDPHPLAGKARPGCDGHQDISPDGCEITASETCAIGPAGQQAQGQVIRSYRVRWNGDASRGEATVDTRSTTWSTQRTCMTSVIVVMTKR